MKLRWTSGRGVKDAFKDSWKSVSYMYLHRHTGNGQHSLRHVFFLLLYPLAGKATTDEELEEMLESGNAAVFTAGVRVHIF